MREIIKRDEKIQEILLQRKELIDQGRKLSEEIERLEKERNKLALQAEKLRDKIIPWVNKIRKTEMDTYENVEQVLLNGDDIVIKVFDAVEEYKKALDEKIKQGKW
jgi:protein subunit release factor B